MMCIDEDIKLVLVTSELDSLSYLVANYSDKYQAAHYLAQIRKSYDLLTIRLKIHFPTDKRIQYLLSRYTPSTTIQENIEPNITSYSRNKGEAIFLCLRSPINNQLEELNTVKFVAFHELAHLITDSIDHTSEFYSNFRFLLSHAIKWRFYDYVDYRRYPTSYCGTIINYSPTNLGNDRKMKSYL